MRDETTRKIIDYHEKVRATGVAPASPFSAEYDDVPWEARTQMLRYSLQDQEHRQRSQPQMRHDAPKEETELTTPQLVSSVLLVMGFGGMAILFVFTMLFLSIATLAGGDGRSMDWERLWLGLMPIFALMGFAGTIGCVITYKDATDARD